MPVFLIRVDLKSFTFVNASRYMTHSLLFTSILLLQASCRSSYSLLRFSEVMFLRIKTSLNSEERSSREFESAVSQWALEGSTSFASLGREASGLPKLYNSTGRRSICKTSK